jgi:hypothetical protein
LEEVVAGSLLVVEDGGRDVNDLDHSPFSVHIFELLQLYLGVLLSFLVSTVHDLEYLGLQRGRGEVNEVSDGEASGSLFIV